MTQAVHAGVSTQKVGQDDLYDAKSMMKAGTSMADAKLGGYSLDQLYCYRDDPAHLPKLAVAEPVEPVAEPVEPVAEDDWHWEEGEEEEPKVFDEEAEEDDDEVSLASLAI